MRILSNFLILVFPLNQISANENVGNEPPQLKLLIKYRSNVGKFSPFRARDIFRQVGVSLIDTIAARSKSVSAEHRISKIEINQSDAHDVIKELVADDDVGSFEIDHVMWKFHLRHASQHATDHAKNDNARSLQEDVQLGMDMVQAPEVWASADRAQSPIKICIVDTGYDLGHADLPSKRITSTATEFGNALKDGDGHGTHCAGIIGAIGGNNVGVVGVMYNPIKFSFHIAKSLDDDGVGSSSTIIEGVQGCINAGAKVINLSLGGGPKSDIASQLFKEAYEDDGVLIFAASGNSGSSQMEYPASYPEVISVGAVYENEAYASFSNYNEQVELMGPGVRINSTDSGGGYNVLSGTSMATPHVAGVAAMIWSYFPECSNHQIRNVLIRTAKNITSDSSRCDEKTGFGIVQAKSAYDLLDKYGCDAGGVDSLPAIGGCAQFSTITTRTPTTRPTQRPSKLPTPIPTRSPSVSPSTTPSVKLTPVPSMTPSLVPAFTSNSPPSQSPAVKPSHHPSVYPSQIPTLSPSSTPSSFPSEHPSSVVSLIPTDVVGCELFQLDILTDDGANETLWQLEQVDGKDIGLIEIGPREGQTLERRTFYKDATSHCLPKGKYIFTIYDTNGNGLEDSSYYEIFLNGARLAKCDACNFGFYETTVFYSYGRSIIKPSKENDYWLSILTEDFDGGFGMFNGSPGYDVMYKREAFGRHGVVRLQDGNSTDVETGDTSSVYSNSIPLRIFYSKFKAVLSFYAIFDSRDSFCLDYSVNSGLDWNEEKCWRGNYDFPNYTWIDDFEYEFWAFGVTNVLSIRFRCAADSNFDDIYIDKINLQGWSNSPFYVFPLQ